MSLPPLLPRDQVLARLQRLFPKAAFDSVLSNPLSSAAVRSTTPEELSRLLAQHPEDRSPVWIAGSGKTAMEIRRAASTLALGLVMGPINRATVVITIATAIAVQRVNRQVTPRAATLFPIAEAATDANSSANPFSEESATVRVSLSATVSTCACSR